jgi:cell division protein FtsI/penicillin-binding protein 2
MVILGALGIWGAHGLTRRTAQARPFSLAIGTTDAKAEAPSAAASSAGPALAAVPAKPALPDGWQKDLALSKARLSKGRLVQSTAAGQVTYTIDPDVQLALEELLEKKQVDYGAAVVVEVATGRVVALAGRSKREPDAEPSSWALKPWAPSASVFKVITAAALLEAGKASAGTSICYHGGRRALTAAEIKDSKQDRSCRSMSAAMAFSTNAVFAKLARKHLPPEKLKAEAEKLGFNRAVELGLPQSPSHLALPSDPLEYARMAAGFWHTELQPLHAAALMATIAAGGQRRVPYIIDHVTLPGGQEVSPARAGSGERVMSAATAQALTQMMVGTTTVGTARGTFTRNGRPVLGVRVAGKTGSLTRRSPSVIDYSWFAGFAPAHAPKYAVAAAIGNGPKWRVRAPLVAKVALGEALQSPGPQADSDTDADAGGSELASAGEGDDEPAVRPAAVPSRSAKAARPARARVARSSGKRSHRHASAAPGGSSVRR